MLCFAVVLGSESGFSSASQCSMANHMDATSYYVPQARSVSKKVLAMQGSEIVNGRVYKYGARTSVPVSRCPTVFGEPTVTGSAGRCLIPFVSVAASSRYPAGTILSVPQLKGKQFRLPNGKMFTHPGYFIVHDVGGAIRGANRFDVFTGTTYPFKTDFYRKIGMVDKTKCPYSFSVVYPENKMGLPDSHWQVAESAIEQSLLSSGDTRMAQYIMGTPASSRRVSKVAAVR